MPRCRAWTKLTQPLALGFLGLAAQDASAPCRPARPPAGTGSRRSHAGTSRAAPSPLLSQLRRGTGGSAHPTGPRKLQFPGIRGILCGDAQGYTRILPQVEIFLSQATSPQTSPPKVLLSSVRHHHVPLPQQRCLFSHRSCLLFFFSPFLHFIPHCPLPQGLGSLQNLPLLCAPAAPRFYFLSQFIFCIKYIK